MIKTGKRPNPNQRPHDSCLDIESEQRRNAQDLAHVYPPDSATKLQLTLGRDLDEHLQILFAVLIGRGQNKNKIKRQCSHLNNTANEPILFQL